MKDRDIVISWPEGKHILNKLIRQGFIAIKSFPSEFDYKSNKIAVVQNNELKLVISIKKVVRGVESEIASGSVKPHFKLTKANKLFFNLKSLKSVSIPCKIKGFHGFGAWRYYNINKNLPILIGENPRRPTGNYIDQSISINKNEFYSRPYIPGVTPSNLSQPEKKLVDTYIAFCNLNNYVVQPYIKSERLYADLYDRSKWRLIEAKASVDRKTIRYAVGQLLDYKGNFNRKPSLGILLPQRPSKSILKFLEDNKITAIWHTSKYRFRDSASGKWTTKNIRN